MIESLVLVVAPVVGGLQWVCAPRRLEEAVLVDVLHLQARHSPALPGQLRGTAALDGLAQYLLAAVLPGVAALSINIADLEGVSHEAAAVVGHDLRGGGESVLGTERVNVALGSELNGFGPGALDVCHAERIGGFIDVFAAIGDWLYVGREGEVGGGGALGNEDLGRGACDVVLQEGGLAVEGLLLGVEILLG